MSRNYWVTPYKPDWTLLNLWGSLMRSSGVCKTSWQQLPCQSCPPKLTKADQLQPPSFPMLWSTPFVEYKRENSAGDITIDMCQGFFLQFQWCQKINAKSWILRGILGLVCFSFFILYFDLLWKICVLWFQFNFLNASRYLKFTLICLLII